MRILYVIQSIARWGGIERVLTDKMNALVRLYGYEVFLLTVDQGTHAFPFALDERVHVQDLAICFHHQYRYSGLRRYYDRWCRNRLFRRRLSDSITAISPDIIIGTTANYVAQINALRGNIPFVVESHSGYAHVMEFEQMRWYHRWQIQRLYRQLSHVTGIVSLTSSDARCWQQIHHQVWTIPNVVHLNDTGRTSECTEKRVIFVGRFSQQKNIPGLIEIWKAVHKRHPDWQLDIYGDGEYRQRFEQEIEALDIRINIFMPTGQIMERYCESSVYVMTSAYEPFGLVLVEAMSCGLPVVAYDCPYGPGDIIEEGKNGFLVAQGNVEQFVERLSLLMADEELRRKMGQQAQQSAFRYDTSQIMPLWKQLFLSLSERTE